MMINKNNNQRGLTLLTVIASIVTVAVIGGGITYFVISSGTNDKFQQICKDAGFNNGKEKTGQCLVNETETNGACCWNGGSTTVSSSSSSTISSSAQSNSSNGQASTALRSWCQGNRPGATVIGLQVYRGVWTCHISSAMQDFYYIDPTDDNYWIVAPVPSVGAVMEKHMIGKACTEYSCSKSVGKDSVAWCNQAMALQCPVGKGI